MTESLELLIMLIVIMLTLIVVVGMTSVDREIDLIAMIALFVPIPRS